MGDPLLFRVRKRLRQKFGYRPGEDNKNSNNSNNKNKSSSSGSGSGRQKQKKWYISTVHSLPINAKRAVSTTEGGEAEAGRACDISFGNACFVTGNVGFTLSSIVVRDIATDRCVVAVLTVLTVLTVVVVVVASASCCCCCYYC